MWAIIRPVDLRFSCVENALLKGQPSESEPCSLGCQGQVLDTLVYIHNLKRWTTASLRLNRNVHASTENRVERGVRLTLSRAQTSKTGKARAQDALVDNNVDEPVAPTTRAKPIPHSPGRLSTMSDQSQTISIPSILLLGVIGVIAVRYFFFTPASSTSRPTNSRTANPQDVEQIATMFPQIPRRNIIWDLQRNGGSVAATTERVLSRGTLDTVCYFATRLE